MSLASYFLIPRPVENGTASITTPKLSPNKGVRAYTVLSEYDEKDDAGHAWSHIDWYVKNGGTVPGPFFGIAEGPGVSQVSAVIAATNAYARFFLVVDIFA